MSDIIETKYVPREHQYYIHQHLKRFSVVLCHRRFGKSVFAINHLINAAIKSKKPMPRFAYLAPTYSQAKRISWSYFKYYLENIPGIEFNEAELRIDFKHNGARIMLLSSENPMTLKGIYLDIVVLDEYAEMNPMVFREVIRPTLSDRKGEALFIGTVKGQNHFWEAYEYARDKDDPNWFGAMFKASETGIIDKEELDDARKVMTDEEYNQEYECDPLAGLVGSYFNKELMAAEREERIGEFPHDPSIQVDTYWDLGIGDMAAIWFCQSKHGYHYMVDYYQVCGASIPEVLNTIKQKNYNYGKFVFPHDVMARDFSTGRTRLQTFFNLGVRNTKVVPKVGLKRESINAARMIFPKCYFHKKTCNEGLKMLANYMRKWNAKNNVFEENPLHNYASNGADAFQQFAMGCRDDSRGSTFEEERSYKDLAAEMQYDIFAV